MKTKLINSQITSFNTYQHYVRRCTSLASNVFIYKKLPELIDISYFNLTLLKLGSIAFFYDDVLDSVIALPYTAIGKLDIYGRPIDIMVRSFNGRYYRKLKYGEYVIMYDNTARSSIYLDILQICERLALSKKTIDVNIVQQRTPRIWKTNQEKARTVKDLSNDIDGFEESVTAFDTLDIDELTCVLAPAPYVADKLDIHLEREWADFYQLVGISHLQEYKKERLLTDEIETSQGGTIASRYSRYEPRKEAIDKINKKWGLEISVEYYDGEPSTIEEKGGNENDNNTKLSTGDRGELSVSTK